MKKLHPEFAKQQQDFEEKFAETYNGDIDIDLPNTTGRYVSSIQLVGGVLEITFSSNAPQASNTSINGKNFIF